MDTIEVEGFRVRTREFRPLDDTAMLVSTWARNQARGMRKPTPGIEREIQDFARECVKKAERIKVLCMEEPDDVILGFIVYLWSDSSAPAFKWVNAKLGDKRPFFELLGEKKE